MLSFPLWYLLIPLAFVFLATSIFLFFNVYHVAKFGLQSMVTRLVVVGYLASYLVVLVVAYGLLASFDWSSTISITDVIPLSSDNTRFGL